ncbi:MAG: LysM peptidoglycan-binding domain-containing protein [Limisphaerales bacterium]
MRWRNWFLLSACVNAVLLAALVWWKPRSSEPPPPAPAPTNQVAAPRTHIEVRRQFFLWSELESTNYVTYIENLRAISCPEQTIRDLIIADVNALYARRRATEVLTPDQQWWRATPDPEVLRAATEKLQALEAERRALLTQLLGPGWDQTEIVSVPKFRGVVLDGPVLGALDDETKRRINGVVAGSQERMEALLARAAEEGRQPTARELAGLREQTRAELQRILSPAAVEEFLLRYSNNAAELRAELAGLRFFNTTPDEFRAMFRARDQFESRIQALADSTNPNDIAARRALEQQREEAIKNALGPRRYAEYVALRDPEYRAAYAQALAAGAPEQAAAFLEINRATQAETARLRANTNLTAQQLAIELKRVELEQLKATAAVTGQPIPPGPDAPPPPPPPPQNRIHTVRMGDTLGSLSTAYGVPVTVLMNLNPGIAANGLRPGQQVTLPPPPPVLTQ